MSIAVDTGLSRLQAAKFLKEGIGPDHHCRLLRSKLARRTFRILEILWQEKRAELSPDDPLASLTNGQRGPVKRYLPSPLSSLKTWLTMPAGHYGTDQDPRRDLSRSAQHVGCDKATVTSRLKGKEVWDWSRNGKGKIPTYQCSDLDELKSERGTRDRIIVKEFAKQSGLNLQTARRLMRREVADHIPIPLKEGGKPATSITKDDAESLIQRIEQARQRQKPGGWGTRVDLCELVQANDVSKRFELDECLKCWEEIGRLVPRDFESEVEQNCSRKGKELARKSICEQNIWKISTFLDLWNRTCSVGAGEAKLKILLPYGTQKTVAEIDDEMKAKGFVGHRLNEAKLRAGVTTYFLDGDRPGAYKVCERIDPKKKQADGHSNGNGKNGHAEDSQACPPKPKVPKRIVTVKPDWMLALEQEHPGHALKLPTTKHWRRETMEMMDRLYDQYILRGKPRSDSIRAVQKDFPDEAPKEEVHVPLFVKRYATRWDPPLSLERRPA